MQFKSLVNNQTAWWRNFHDPLLNELIEEHAAHNLNLKTAHARVRTARAQYALARAQLLPTVSISASPPMATGIDINQLIALAANLDPDLFGKNRQYKQMAKANLEADEAELDFALINLYAEIASCYMELREAQTRNKVLLNSILSNKRTLQFIRSRYKAGHSNYLSIAQQNGLIEAQLADVEQNKALIIALLHKLELLTGNTPGTLAKKLLPYKPIPTIVPNMNLGVPSELLRRRPDIIAAERRIAAAHANIRATMANLLPQVTIGWLLGWQTQTLASSILTARNLFSIQNPESTFYGTFGAPLFNRSLFYNVELRRREKAQIVVQYQIIILRALHEVEMQYNYFQYNKKSVKHLKDAVQQKRLALKLVKDIYQKVFSDFSSVLHAEEELERVEFIYLQNIVRLQISVINLYKALGGNLVFAKKNQDTNLRRPFNREVQQRL